MKLLISSKKDIEQHIMAATHKAEATTPPPPPSKSSKQPSSTILRNALRYTLSPDEYQKLQQSPSLRKSPLLRRAYADLVTAPDDYTAASVRAALRIFIASQAGLQLWGLLKAKLLARGREVGWVAFPA